MKSEPEVTLALERGSFVEDSTREQNESIQNKRTLKTSCHLDVQNESAWLTAAVMIAIVPGYISRSVAGSYDNEGIAIFCMLLTYYLWIKSVKTGSIAWAAACSVAYFYMVSSWGGYVFLINLIPLHVFTLIITGRFSHRIYVAYSTLYCIGTILSMQIPFVGFQPVQSSEHMLVSPPSISSCLVNPHCDYY